jgi:hypothetical protein
LKLQHKYQKAKHNGETVLRSWVKPLEPLDLGCLFPHRKDSFDWRPILYDLSCLTKPIEGGVYLINEKADVISKDQGFSIIQNDDMIILDFDEEYVFHTISMKNMMRQPYEIIQILLKHHFNVFNLPESEYINKATLTQKQ